MISRILPLAILFTTFSAAAEDDAALAKRLAATYSAWQQSVATKSANQWRQLTAPHRQMEVRNRLVSEKRPFPAGVFDLPAPPPTLKGLRCIHVSRQGPTAKATFYGPIDFGIGGEPAHNILLLSFVVDSGTWKYDKADFVNLAAMPEVREEFAKGDLSYLAETPEFLATGSVPPTPPAVSPAKYIAKVYVFCPGREVNVQVNRVSRHRFANAKEAEVVLGGAKDGINEINYTVKPLEGGTGKEALAIRVYLMSEIEGTKPVIAYEYIVKEGGTLKAFDNAKFSVDPAKAGKLIR